MASLTRGLSCLCTHTPPMRTLSQMLHPSHSPDPKLRRKPSPNCLKVCSAHATALPATCFVAPFHYPVSYADLVILPRILACLVPVALPPPAFTLPPQLAHWFQLPT